MAFLVNQHFLLSSVVVLVVGVDLWAETSSRLVLAHPFVGQLVVAFPLVVA